MVGLTLIDGVKSGDGRSGRECRKQLGMGCTTFVEQMRCGGGIYYAVASLKRNVNRHTAPRLERRFAA